MCKLLALALAACLCFSLASCAPKTLTIEEIELAFARAGYEVTEQLEAPTLNLTGSQNIYGYYFGEEFVTFYEYKSSKEIDSAINIFPHFEDWARNKNFMMANGTPEMIKLFESL